jgi:hypothetical protein
MSLGRSQKSQKNGGGRMSLGCSQKSQKKVGDARPQGARKKQIAHSSCVLYFDVDQILNSKCSGGGSPNSITILIDVYQ